MRERLGQLWLIWRAVGLVRRAAPRLTVAGWGIALLQSALGLVGLYVIKLVVDAAAVWTANAAPGHGMARLGSALALVGGLAGVTLGSAILYWLAWLVAETQGQLVTDRVQELIQQKSIALDLSYYESPDYQDTLHRAQQDAPYRPLAIVQGLGQAVQSALSLGLLLVFLGAQNAVLALALLVPAIPGVLLRFRYANGLHEWTRRRTTTAQRLATYLHLLVTVPAAAKEVRLFDLGDLFVGRFQAQRNRLRHERPAGSRSGTLLPNLGASARAAPRGGLRGLRLHRLPRARRPAERGGAWSSITRPFSAARARSAISSAASPASTRTACSLSHFFTLLGLPTRAAPPVRPVASVPAVKDGIVFDRVSFRYPGSARTALQDISLTIKPGEQLALVGANGSGKTTLVKLLCRLYPPASGTITIDGVDLEAMDEGVIHGLIRVVFQDFIRYHLAAGENIRLGDCNLADDDPAIAAAARRSGAAETIARLPQGYATTLSNWFAGGEELSAGEWQRIAVARAFVHAAPIVILDEPTSSLDALTEHALLGSLRELTRDRISIVISHRFAIVREADRICVLHDGRICELGSHAELIARGGRYAEMFALQAESYLDPKETSACV